eukprot:g13002.t1 g13002   contig7:650190-651360(+)
MMSTNSSPSSSYWNRETGTPTDYSAVPITRTARILALSDATDTYNTPLYDEPLPEGATLLAVGATLADFDKEEIHKEKPNVLFVSHPMARGPLVEILERFPSVEWVHTRSAGIDFIASEGLAKSTVTLTNAERNVLLHSRRILHDGMLLRGATLGVVGYGDIGRASAKLAKAYGMKVIGVKRNPVSLRDEYCDVMYGTDKLNTLMEESDYVLISTPLTEQTRNMISKEVLSNCKPSTVIINVGRGPIIDEEALIEALQNRAIKGAGLDVMTVEPLPKSSPLWKLDNVLLSPHNMDMTLTFMRESTEFFVKENLPRWLRGMEVLNQVDKVAGY